MTNFKLTQNVSFSSLTTLKIGGRIKYFAKAKSPEQIIQLIEMAKEKDLPYLVIGGGSNLLVSDEGFDGLVIQNLYQSIVPQKRIRLGRKKVGDVLEVGAGTQLQQLVNYANRAGMAGLEKLAGIPGSVGGAVYGNAGAYGQIISDNIVYVEILRDREIEILRKYDCKFGYRDSVFKKTYDIILKIGFLAFPGNPLELQKISQEIIKTRTQKYHPHLACPGSFFKNVEVRRLSQNILKNIPRDKIMFGKIPTGWLLEMVGAKGVKHNGVEIASWHGNLFVNRGGGTAEDFLYLAKKYKDKVQKKFGIMLEPEVQLIGFNKNPL